MFRHTHRDLVRALYFEEDEQVTPQNVGQEPEEEETILIPEDLSALSDEELADLRSQLREGFAETREATPLDIDLLEQYAEAARVVSAEITGRETQREEDEDRAAELESEVFAEEESEDEDEEEVEEPEVEASEEEEAEEEETEEEEPVVEAVEVPEPVAASATRAEINRPREAPITLPRRTRPLPTGTTPRHMVASGGNSAGEPITREDIPRLVQDVYRGHDPARFESYAIRGERKTERYPVLRIDVEFPEDLRVGANTDMLEVLDRAADPTRIPGGSLTAAGWCAPSETIYDLCALETAEGILSIPGIAITRGGLNHTVGPDFGELFTETGFTFTEAELADDPVKECFEVPCPEFDEVSWSVAGVCITADLLMRQGFPEIIDRYVTGSLVAHQHRLSAARTAALVADSTAETFAGPAGVAGGAAAPLLNAVELAAEKIRYKNRMSRSAVLEAVFPAWAEAVIRADIAYRQNKDALSVSDAEIASWFADRKVAPQFVYNWQDLDDTADEGYPDSIDFLIYPIGTWVGASNEIIRLDVLYDSTLLSTNRYQALFTEEQFLIAKRCHDSRVITVDICASGQTGAQDITCEVG